MAANGDNLREHDATQDLLLALRRAENELAVAKAALERKTQELAHALAVQKEIESELHQQRDWRRRPAQG